MQTITRRPASGGLGLLVVILLFVLGFAIRLYDLTDLPLDFYPTRQLLSALKARGMYYESRTDVPDWQRRFAVQEWKSRAEIEPEIVERLAAFTYRFTGEQLWIGRVYSSLFWIIGGIFLFLLARDLTSGMGALLGLAFYLFLPFGVTASRSFQPDPLMTMLIVAFWWAVYRWTLNWESASRMGWAALAGLLGGLAILVKFPAAFFVIGGGLGEVLGAGPILRTLRRADFWLLVLLGALPGAAYLVYGTWVAGFLGQQFGGRFIPSLLLSPSYYLSWLTTLNHVLGGAALALSLLGVFFFRDRPARIFAISLWAAYLLYGLYFDYHIWSHEYYNLPLVALAAVSISPLADWLVLGWLQLSPPSRLARFAAVLVLGFGLLAVLWGERAALKAVDYRPQAERWAAIGRMLGPQARVAALAEDYGSRLAYWGWVDASAWPLSGDIAYHVGLRGAQENFEEQFQRLAGRRDFFLVTLPGELAMQPFLLQRLAAYPIYSQGEGFVIYDLRSQGAQ